MSDSPTKRARKGTAEASEPSPKKSKKEETASPVKRGRGRPKGVTKKSKRASPKKGTGGGRGRPKKAASKSKDQKGDN